MRNVATFNVLHYNVQSLPTPASNTRSNFNHSSQRTGEMASIINPEDFVSLLLRCKMSLHITDKKKWLPLSNLPSPDNFSSTLLLFIFTSSFLLSVCLPRSLLFPPLTDSVWVQFLLLRLKRGISQHGATQPGNFPNQGEQSATTLFFFIIIT